MVWEGHSRNVRAIYHRPIQAMACTLYTSWRSIISPLSKSRLGGTGHTFEDLHWTRSPVYCIRAHVLHILYTVKSAPYLASGGGGGCTKMLHVAISPGFQQWHQTQRRHAVLRSTFLVPTVYCRRSSQNRLQISEIRMAEESYFSYLFIKVGNTVVQPAFPRQPRGQPD